MTKKVAKCKFCSDYMMTQKGARKKVGKGIVDIGCWILWILRGIKIKNIKCQNIFA